ncbi:BA14K family protein [Nitratireductor sp.]|uniref:BA14K family protein n=1 Tax=Nitratireductor sp. TaxID=1872084 RepID=UPI0025F7F7EA|nr:BA14K family protein [Nitratireductor sp.]
MRCLKLILVVALCLVGTQIATAGRLLSATSSRICLDGWNERRAMRHLFPGRMQLTLGDMHRRHWLERCRTDYRLHHRPIPSWSPWHDPHGRFAGYFYGFNDVYGPGRRPLLRPRHGARSFYWRYRPAQRTGVARAYPGHAARAAHLAWCDSKYRSFRASDNTFQPYRGPRKHCVSPYGR